MKQLQYSRRGRTRVHTGKHSTPQERRAVTLTEDTGRRKSQASSSFVVVEVSNSIAAAIANYPRRYLVTLWKKPDQRDSPVPLKHGRLLGRTSVGQTRHLGSSYYDPNSLMAVLGFDGRDCVRRPVQWASVSARAGFASSTTEVLELEGVIHKMGLAQQGQTSGLFGGGSKLVGNYAV